MLACKTKQPTTDTPPAVGERIRTAAELLQKIDANQPVYSNLNIKFASKITTKKGDNSVRGKLKIRRDSCVWVSALPLGIEAVRLLATREETGMVNFLEKKYFRGGYDLLSAQVGYTLQYDMLQAALTGVPVFYADRSTYQFDDDRKNGYYFSPYDKNRFEKITDGKEMPTDGAHTVQALWFEADNARLIKNVMYDVDQKRFLEIEYANYTAVGNNTFPANISIVVRTPKGTVSFTAEYTKTEVDASEMEYPFSVPASYEKMELR